MRTTSNGPTTPTGMPSVTPPYRMWPQSSVPTCATSICRSASGRRVHDPDARNRDGRGPLGGRPDFGLAAQDQVEDRPYLDSAPSEPGLGLVSLGRSGDGRTTAAGRCQPLPDEAAESAPGLSPKNWGGALRRRPTPSLSPYLTISRRTDIRLSRGSVRRSKDCGTGSRPPRRHCALSAGVVASTYL